MPGARCTRELAPPKTSPARAKAYGYIARLHPPQNLPIEKSGPVMSTPSPPLTLIIRTDANGVQHLSTMYNGCEVPVPDTRRLKAFMESVRQAIAEKQES